MKKIFLMLVALVALMSMKWHFYYEMVQLSEGSLMAVILTVIISLWVFFALEKAGKHKGAWLFVIFYGLVSLIFLVDVVYFKQFNARATVRILQNAGVIGDIGDSILAILSPKHFIALIDMPFWIGLTALLHKQGERFSIRWRILVLLPALMGILFSVPQLRIAYTEKIGAREFFGFHVEDLVSSVNGRFSELMVDQFEILGNVSIKNKIYQDPEALKAQKYWGIAEGRNLIVIQIESFQDFVVNRSYEGQVLTPFLNELIAGESLYFDSYYQQLGMGNTSDAEFATNNAIYPTVYGQSYALYQENDFRGLPWQLRDQGYTALAFHGYKGDFWSRDIAYPGQGFERFYSEKDFVINEPIGFGLNDFEFFEQSVEILKTYKQPFYGFLITLSNHHPYQLPSELQEIELNPEHQGTLFGDYLQSVRYTDNALRFFFEKLKDAGYYENSVIALYGDHHGLVITDLESKSILEDYLDKPYEFDEMLHIPLIVHTPGSGVGETISTIGTQVDFMPTIMNLMGIPNDNFLIFGQDLVNATEGLAAFQAYTAFGSFISEDFVFEMSREYIFNKSRAWNRKTGEPVDVNLCYSQYNEVKEEFAASKYILDHNLLADAKTYYGEFASEDGTGILGQRENITQDVVFVGGHPVNGMTGTNSKEAMDLAFKAGDRLLALNFSWTEDGEIVAMENPAKFSSLLEAPFQVEDAEAFRAAQLIGDLTQLDLRGSLTWLSRHKDVLVMAFTNGGSIEFSKYLYDNFRDALSRFVIVVDSFEKYNRLGFLNVDRIAIDADALKNSNEDLKQFVENNSVYMVITSQSRMDEDLMQTIAASTNLYVKEGGELLRFEP
ncbi:sulfatase-like hydrolase/transferase [Acidaminobacter hydrogenoformans]|uniref:Phosphoglycerol transferase MdoB n=1 Tax=Acidaminobacter hydrogenoformans DSM 2784 TaxID=1120920 RepID=A0A1G5RTP5_9FIRM|nr:sulfatase-like hydrolase/transferase [Acidaminobacter hydrogenoformans]SCZ77228.1 Phosphoglycerol transferase MdoB [Acidaminobacter hydrogenoformans DSM 2784]